MINRSAQRRHSEERNTVANIANHVPLNLLFALQANPGHYKITFNVTSRYKVRRPLP